MRVTQELLYDSEATLRLVDQALEELDMTDPFHPSPEGLPGYRTEQLRGGAADAASRFVRAYWEIHDALELLRDSHTALQPTLQAPAASGADEHDRLDRALATIDQLRSEDADPRQERAHDALRRELLGLADQLHSREAETDRLHRAAALLSELEARLTRLVTVFNADTSELPA